MTRLLDLSPDIDLAAATDEFARTGRTRIAPLLTDESTQRARDLLEHRTPWALAWQAGATPPAVLRAEQLATLDSAQAAAIQQRLRAAMAAGDYAFCYATYPLVQALLDGWAPGGEHEQLLTDLNQPALLDLARAVSGLPALVKADGQATLYRPGHFLAAHNDSEPSKGRQVAYVLGLAGDPDGAPWRPEYGGALQFLTDDGEPDVTLLPTYNSLTLFRVPRPHHVTSVASFAPATRFAITGWFRDR